ncbi:MAG: UvrD-helicase domain-containing protein [Parachlamydiales bacterium]|nr:UvrD-helicase domain-containing protein [Parachlamydiales bacterium]
MDQELSKLLNQEQYQAVCHFQGPLLVLAGAGSGKTRIVTYRIARLMREGVSPSAILALTFTNKAAHEMLERVRKLTNSYVSITTFHSIGAKILRESIAHLGYNPDFTIYDADDAEKLIRTCLDTLNLKNKDYSPRAFAGMISNAKNQMQSFDEVDSSGDSPVEQVFPQVYRLYQTRLKECNAVDFDDLLYLTTKLFQDHPQVLEQYQDRWQFLHIDEYQDTNHAQYIMAKLLVAKSGNIFVVGDPDQSIYSWRGANIRNILDFQKDYPGAKLVRLEQNYRSRSNILDAANSLIVHNRNRLEKRLWSDRGQGEKISVYIGEDERMEADFVVNQICQQKENSTISFNEMVIFYRTNFQSRAFEDALLRRGIPYQIIGGVSFYQRREIKDILGFIRLAYSGSDLISFLRTVNIPKRGIGAATLDKICLEADIQKKNVMEFCTALVNQETILPNARLGLKQREGLKNFVELIRELRVVAASGSVRELVVEAIRLSGYLGYLKDDKESYEERKENLDELISKAAEWELTTEEPTLQAFLEELSLKADANANQQGDDKVNLMTLHNGKGLEFDVAFLVGMEEDLFPHANCRGSYEAIEEERRLCYVGMTRAKEVLYLTAAQSRFLWGTFRYMRPSRFLTEIPKEYLQNVRYHHRVQKFT